MMKTSHKYYKKQAFTLIEMVVVILIIGVLSAYMMPRYFKNTGRIHEAAVENFATVLQSSLDAAANEWYVNVRPVLEMDLDHDGTMDVVVNSEGYPLYLIKDGQLTAPACETLVDLITGGRVGMTLTQMSNDEVDVYFNADNSEKSPATFGVTLVDDSCVYTYLPYTAQRYLVIYRPDARLAVSVAVKESKDTTDSTAL